jgi:PEP-CTERM/exosortase A-associated glycosyltransferase
MRSSWRLQSIVDNAKSVLDRSIWQRSTPGETVGDIGEHDPEGGRLVDQEPQPDASQSSPDPAEWAKELRQFGRDAFDRGDFRLAEERLRQAVELVPGNHWNWLWLARAQQRGGDRAGSLVSARTALGLKPDWPAAAELVASLLAAAGKTDEAVEVLRQLSLRHGDDMEVLARILGRLRTLNAEAEFADVAEAMIGLDPTDERARAAAARVRSRLGQEAFAQRDYRLAEDRFRESIGFVATEPWPWLWLARAQQRLGERAGSIASARVALDLRPGWPPAAQHLAPLLVAEGKTGAALDLLKQIALRHASDVDVLRRVLWRFRRLQAHAEVVEVAEAILRLDPWDESALAATAFALGRLGTTADAERYLETVAARPGAPKLAGAWVRYLLDDGRSRDAWTSLQRDSDAADPAQLRRTAQALWRGGHVEEANRAYALAVALTPENQFTLRRQRVAKSESAVLRGEWRPPAMSGDRVQPIPGRVLHVVGKSLPYDQAGYTIRTQSIARAQRQTGLDPHVVSQFGFPWNLRIEAPEEETVDGLPYHRLRPVDGLPDEAEERLTRHSLGLAARVQQLRPGILHAHSDFRNALVAVTVGQALGVPVVYEVRGFWEETWLSKRDAESIDAEVYRLRRERELEAMTRSDHVVTLSEGMRAELVARGVPESKITIVPNAVDVETFVPVERDAQLGGELAIGADEVVLGYISSLTHYEGISFLLQAIARLVAAGEPVRGLIVGDGPERASLQIEAARLGLTNRVVFTGRVPHQDILRYYGLIDVFVIPRTADRVSQLVTPLKPLEAMATGRAVVVSGVDALREMIVDGETGLVFRPEDADHLAEVVAPLILDRARREKLGGAARAWVCAHRTWEQNGRRYLDLYRALGVPLPDA